MATIQTQSLNKVVGTKPTLAAASTSDKYPAGPGQFAVIAIGATPTVITIVDPRKTDYGADIPDIVMPSASNVEKFIPLDRALADADGFVTITMSSATGVTVAAVSAV